MIILIDALAILFRSYYAIPELQNERGEHINAVFGLLNVCLELIEKFDPEHIIACFDSPDENIRKSLDHTYKSNRTEADEDLISQIVLAEELTRAFGFGCLKESGYEGDDIIGSISSQTKEDCIIVSMDRDLLQLVEKDRVKMYLIKNREKILLNEEGVKEMFNLYPKQIIDYKALSGDASDNIKGVKGIGDKTAIRLINKYGDLDEVYKQVKTQEFIKNGFTKRIQTLLINEKDEAYKSKDLATVYTKLPILKKYNLNKNWKESIQKAKLDEILTENQFNFHKSKIDKLLNTEIQPSVDSKKINKDELKLCAIALWILDSNMTNATEEEVLSYSRKNSSKDALEMLEREIKINGFENLYEMEKKLHLILLEMQKRGVLIDEDYMKETSGEYNKLLLKLEKEIYTLTKTEFNINSPKQLAEVLFKVLNLPQKRKSKSTKEEILLTLKDKHEVIPLILEYRKLKKLTSTYIDNFLKLLTNEKRIHTTYIQNGTTTGRLSSKTPNLQNIPVANVHNYNIRRCFIAPEGFVLFGCDYSQIELKVAAILSQDENLLDAFNKNKDIHASVAAAVFNIDESEVSEKHRAKAKTVNFGVLYGMGARALSKSLEISLQEAQEFIDNYKKKFSQLNAYMEGLKEEARETGGVTTLFGRIRIIDGINSRIPFIQKQAERMAINSPIQGTAADIIKCAMVNIQVYLKETKQEKDIIPILQVHDELVFEVKNGVKEESLKKVREIMESSEFPVKKTLKLNVKISSGKSWSQLK